MITTNDLSPNFKQMLPDLFKKQQELLDKYGEMEGIPSYPFDINDKTSQVWIKDFLWRITEEMGEAYMEYLFNNTNEMLEELSDMLHFYLELMILVGVEVSDSLSLCMTKAQDQLKESGGVTFERAVLEAIQRITMTGNLLKNKPWKQKMVKTNIATFKSHVIIGFYATLGLFVAAGCIPTEVYSLYMSKHQINKERQETGY